MTTSYNLQTLYINKPTPADDPFLLEFERADTSHDILPKTTAKMPGFNNSFDFNRSQDSITAKLLDNTAASPKKLHFPGGGGLHYNNNHIMPEINLMLSGKALIDPNAVNVSPWDGRVEYVQKKSLNKTPIRLTTKKQ